MRTWGIADPALLGRKHLYGEHVENHQMQNAIKRRMEGQTSGGWMNHPEVLRYFESDDPLGWLTFRHELLVIEIGRRGGSHNSPAIGHMPRFLHLALDVYALGSIKPTEFDEWVEILGFPASRLEQDAPWDRDGQTIHEYVTGHCFGGGQREGVLA